MDNYGFVELLGNNGLFVAAEIVAPLCWVAGLLENLDRFVVGDSRKWWRNPFELRDVALDHSQLSRPVLGHRLDDCAHQPFGELDGVFQMGIRRLRLEHPEFGEMAARFGFFSAKCWAECVDLSECSCRRLHVKLAGLCEGSLL